jgi:hypothetical protein
MNHNKYYQKGPMLKKSDSKSSLNKITKSPVIKTTTSQNSMVITSPKETPTTLFPNVVKDLQDINMKDLIFNVTDDHKTLINKNRRLVQYVVQSANKISALNEIIKELEESKSKDKEELLIKLDKISANYRIFAESHQKLGKLQEEYDNIKNSQENIIRDNQNYEDFIKFSLLDFIANFKKLQGFISTSSNFHVNQFQGFMVNFREELKNSMNNIKLKLNNSNSFEVYFKEFEKISQENKRIEKREYIRTGSNSSLSKRPLTPEMEMNEKNIHSKDHHTLEAYNLPFKSMNSKTGKNRQKSFDSSANRFMDFMQNKSSCGANDVEDVRSSFNSINENKLMIGRNNSLIKSNIANINNKISDKTIEKSLSLSEGFDLVNNINKQKEPIQQEEKKNDYPEEKQKIFCVAKVDFVPKRKNELQFKKGEIIEVLMLNEDGSCQGVLNGKRGLFPFNYVAKLE